MNPLERTLDNDKTHFAVLALCLVPDHEGAVDLAVGATAQKMGIPTQELYNRLKKVGQAIGQLKFAKPSHQMCIRSQLVVDQYLHFEGHEILNKKGG